MSDLMLSYRGKLVATSTQTCLAKYPNKNNRIHLVVVPLADEVSNEIEAGKLRPKGDPKSGPGFSKRSTTGTTMPRGIFGHGVP